MTLENGNDKFFRDILMLRATLVNMSKMLTASAVNLSNFCQQITQITKEVEIERPGLKCATCCEYFQMDDEHNVVQKFGMCGSNGPTHDKVVNEDFFCFDHSLLRRTKDA